MKTNDECDDSSMMHGQEFINSEQLSNLSDNKSIGRRVPKLEIYDRGFSQTDTDKSVIDLNVRDKIGIHTF